MRLVLAYGDNVRLAEISANRGRFANGRLAWKLILLDPASRRQKSEYLSSLTDVAKGIERHLLFWFGNSPSHEFLLRAITDVARDRFEANANYMRKHAYIYF